MAVVARAKDFSGRVDFGGLVLPRGRATLDGGWATLKNLDRNTENPSKGLVDVGFEVDGKLGETRIDVADVNLHAFIEVLTTERGRDLAMTMHGTIVISFPFPDRDEKMDVLSCEFPRSGETLQRTRVRIQSLLQGLHVVP